MNIYKIILIIFAVIAAFNIGTGCIFTIEKILKTFGAKAKVFVYIYVIATSLGIIALKIIIEGS